MKPSLQVALDDLNELFPFWGNNDKYRGVFKYFIGEAQKNEELREENQRLTKHNNLLLEARSLETVKYKLEAERLRENAGKTVEALKLMRGVMKIASEDDRIPGPFWHNEFLSTAVTRIDGILDTLKGENS